MISGKPPDHLIKVATLIKDFWKLWGLKALCSYVDVFQSPNYFHIWGIYPKSEPAGCRAWTVSNSQCGCP